MWWMAIAGIRLTGLLLQLERLVQYKVMSGLDQPALLQEDDRGPAQHGGPGEHGHHGHAPHTRLLRRARPQGGQKEGRKEGGKEGNKEGGKAPGAGVLPVY